jgi:hypothetical protein
LIGSHSPPSGRLLQSFNNTKENMHRHEMQQINIYLNI